MNQEDRSRLEDFRQFRKEVRGSSEYLLVGIDVAKDKHHAFFGTAAGKTVFRRMVFENSLEGFRKLLGQAEAMKVREGLKQIRESLRQIDEKIHEVCSPFPEYECLLSIPGFGRDVSSKVLGAIGDPFRFQNGRQVLELAGLDLSAERSGKNSERAVPVLSKRGKADLRYALYQAALIASIRDRHFIVYFTNQLRGREREPGIKTKMRVKLAAKLLILAWTLMKKKEPFNPDYLNLE